MSQDIRFCKYICYLLDKAGERLEETENHYGSIRFYFDERDDFPDLMDMLRFKHIYAKQDAMDFYTCLHKHYDAIHITFDAELQWRESDDQPGMITGSLLFSFDAVDNKGMEVNWFNAMKENKFTMAEFEMKTWVSAPDMNLTIMQELLEMHVTIRKTRKLVDFITRRFKWIEGMNFPMRGERNEAEIDMAKKSPMYPFLLESN